MKQEDIIALFQRFEAAALKQDGVEFWRARVLYTLFGYTQWRNFLPAIDKAKESAEAAGMQVSEHFAHVRKSSPMPHGGIRNLDDVLLTRYACYLIAQNGDPRKDEIAFAQNYFAVQTRRAELVQQRILESERVVARQKLRETETRLSEVIYERGVDDKGFGYIRSLGDAALFGMRTQDLKTKFGAGSKPLADVLPTIGIKAKDLAAEMTSTNVVAKDLYGVTPIAGEHVDNNIAVREMLRSRGIEPSQLTPAEDVNKVARRINADQKKVLKGK